jgi:tol-pal system protein YbgF
LKITSAVLLAGILVLALAGPAKTQSREIIQLQGDMIKLQNQVAQLQKSLDEKNGVILGLVEKLVDQGNVLNAELAKVNTAVGTIRTDNQGTIAELRTAVRTLNDSVEQVNDGLSGLRTTVSSLSQSVSAIATAEALETPEEILRNAGADVFAGNYDLALGAYQDFLTKFPNHPRAAEAQFGIADSYYNGKKFDQAIVEYDILLQKFPESDKSKAALYKKGLAQAELNQTQEAINTLSSVRTKFPGTQEAEAAQIKINELVRRR